MSWHSVPWASGLSLDVSIRFSGSTWTDVTDDVISFGTSHMRSGRDPVWPAGQLKLTLKNPSNDYTPSNSGGPYYGDLIPGKAIRIRAKYGSIEYDVGFWIIDDWFGTPVFTQPAVSGGWETATVTALQPISELASWRQAAVTSPVGAGELSSERVARILTAAGWSFGSVVSGRCQVQGLLWDADALSLLRSTLKAEGGYAWCDGTGRVVVKDRHLLASSTSRVAQATFGTGVGQIPYLADPPPVLSSGIDQVSTRVERGNVGDVSSLYEDSTGMDGRLIWDSDVALIATDRQRTIALAERELLIHAHPIEHPQGVTLLPSTAAGWDAALSLEPMERVDVAVPRADGTTSTFPCWLRGVSHAANPGQWRTSLHFSPIRPDALASWGTWGSGVWGTFVWAW